MAKRKAAPLPTPRPVYPAPPSIRTASYRSLARTTDRYLARAEEALRSAALLWSECDAGLETQLDELAAEVFQERHATVETIQELYGDRLSESPL